jgi:hypothetical protein
VATLERIGQSRQGPGYLLLELLSLDGWAVDVVADPDRHGGVIVTASMFGRRSVVKHGGSVAEVAVDLVKEARNESDA